ncbi:hypothetical protein SAMN05421847_2055 [Halpernia humi]|uniref:Uncharacterized protein n=1 Tax=Halpernia humi TaxID=493375 RepID=A0A1H5ZAE9_9FLAO|nr:L-type lectin-domain containing protein [Halpernia humi]SEG33044.1 hypothetical protein SAMN05421847_2055 [Halpernia humi]
MKNIIFLSLIIVFSFIGTTIKAQQVTFPYDGTNNLTQTTTGTINQGIQINFNDLDVVNNFYTENQTTIYMYIALETDNVLSTWEYPYGDINNTSTLIAVPLVADTNSGASPNYYSVTINPRQYFTSVPAGTTVYGYHLLFRNQFGTGGNNQTVNLYIDLQDAVYSSTCTGGNGNYDDADCDGVLNIIDLDDDNDGILDTVECTTTVGSVYANENMTTAPSTDMRLDGVAGCSSGTADNADGNPNRAGTYKLSNGNMTNYSWGTPTGIISGAVPSYASANAPSGAYMIINAFGSSGLWCESITANLNGNSTSSELVSKTLSAVAPGQYKLGAFFAELTNTNPETASYQFVVKNASTGVVIATKTLYNITQNNKGWQYNETDSFTITSPTDLIISVQQTVNRDTGADIAMDNFTLYQFTCNTDTDGDGIPNYLDLDSDNDGCLDAIEGDENVATAMLVNVGGTLTVGTGSSANNQNLCAGSTCVDANGVPTVVNSGGAADIGADQGQGIGNSQTVGSASSITTQPTNKSIVAGNNTSFSVVASGGSGTRQYQWQVSIDGGVTYSNISNAGVYSNATTSTLNITGATVTINAYLYRVIITQSDYACANVTSSSALLNVFACGGTSEYTLAGDATIDSGNIRITRAVNDQYGTAWSNINYNLNNNISHSFKVYLGTNNANGADGMAYVIRGVGSASSGLTGRGLGYGGITPSVDLEFDTYQNADLGTNDPAADHLSLHHNGDYNSTGIIPGTSDVLLSNIEDGLWHDVTVNWDATTKNLRVTFDGIERYNITRDLVALDFGGNPNVIIGMTGSTGGFNNEQRFCPSPINITSLACYKPATTGAEALPTIHGITALGRAGTDNGNWPMARNGAWTALESKTKGFVVNRVANPSTDIASPVKGMMVYDTTNNCLSINTDGTTTGWKCFNTQTCPTVN